MRQFDFVNIRLVSLIINAFFFTFLLQAQDYIIDFDTDVPNINIIDGQNAIVTGNVLDNSALTDAGFDYTITIQVSGGPSTTPNLLPATFTTAASQFNTGTPQLALNGAITSLDLDFMGHDPPIGGSTTPAQAVFYRDTTSLMEVTITLSNGYTFENVTYELTDIDYTFNHPFLGAGEPNFYNYTFSFIDRVKILSGLGGNVYTPNNAAEIFMQGNDLIAQFTDANNNGVPDVSDAGLVGNLDTDGNITIYNPGNIGNTIHFMYDDYGSGIEGDADGVHDFDAVDQRIGLGTGITFSAREVANTIDLSLSKEVDKAIAGVGEDVVFTLVVTNDGEIPATNVAVNELLPSTVIYTAGGYTATAGTFDGSIWSIPSVAAGDSATIDITVTIGAEGVHYNQAEIMAMDGVDIDSTPNNADSNEDDLATACVSTPVEVCEDGTITVLLTAPSGYNNYQWYKDGGLIGGATNDSYTAIEVGEYTYTVEDATVNSCEGTLCCPVIIVSIQCCPNTQCIPITISKVNE